MSVAIRRFLVTALALVAIIAGSVVTVARTAPAAAATTFVVDTVADNAALSACTGAAADCSLRGAIAAANVAAGVDTINFDIPAGSCPGGVCRITLTEGPLALDDAAMVDATTQPQNGAPQANVCATATEPSYMRVEIVVDPTLPGSVGGDAFRIDHAVGASSIKGFAIGFNNGAGINSAVHATDGSGHHLSCNHITLDAAGEASLGTNLFFAGVMIEFLASDMVVGTDGDGNDDIAERNVFGPRAGYTVYVNANDGNRIAGNYFGFTADGATTLGAGRVFARQSSSDNLIGTDGDGTSDDIERNYFAGNYGVTIYPATYTTADNRVAGNVFGFTPTGAVTGGAVVAIEVSGLEAVDTGYEIRDNVIGLADTGVLIDGIVAGATVMVSGNTLGLDPSGAAAPNDVAIDITGTAVPVLSDNRIVNSTVSGLQLADTAALGAGSTGNCVVGNTAGVDNATTVPVTFEDNWWGASDGPSGSGPGSGDTVSVDVDFTPWLIDPAASCNTAPVATDTAFSVPENATIGTSVGTVPATDDGATLVYSITAGNPGGVFAIDAATGAITTAAVLDFETTLSYSLTVEVSDGLLSDTATITVNVTNSPPAVSTAVFSVAEDVAVGTLVGTVTAIDSGATLAYSITAGDPGGVFAIDAATGAITTAKALDFETTPSYSLTVSVSDGLLSGTASVTVNVTDVVEGPPGATFDDVPIGHTFFADIEWLAAVGVTKGCNPPVNDMFCPDAAVTRGQMAAFLHRALEGTLLPGDVAPFTDTAGSIFASDIEWLGSVGVTKGCNPPANDMFCPNAAVTRGQMAAFLVRAFGYTAGAGSDRFTDDDGSVFEADIERLAEAGVTLGCNPPANDMFCPDAQVTRAQMAAFLHRAMGE